MIAGKVLCVSAYSARTHFIFMLSKPFVSGTIKIQNNQDILLSPEEKVACAHGLKEVADEPDASPSPVRSPVRKKFRDSITSKIESMNSCDKHHSDYCDGMHLCVTATNACGERWNSMADAVLTKQKKGLAPVMVNDIMCLKWNKRLWGLNEVVEANLRRKNESKSIKGKKSRKAHRSRVQSRLNEIAEWDGFYDALETVADDTAEKASPKEVSEDQPMEEVAQVVESSDSSSDSDTS